MGDEASPSDHSRPSADSIDSLIAWLHQQRQQRPQANLSELLRRQPVARELHVDLACIDLIHRRRLGHSVRVEDYLADLPTLSADDARLDLIDAELCVTVELGQVPNVDDYRRRFPDLETQIKELVSLDVATPQTPATPQLPAAEEVSGAKTRRREDSADFSYDGPLQMRLSEGESIPPVDVPAWFVGEKPVACSPGRWLIQGRDPKRGVALGMKVVGMSAQVTSRQTEDLLDACEAAARVNHPVWVSPIVASVQSRRLIVIRRWAFAHRWANATESDSIDRRLRQLASVAFALQAAHSCGAAHGGVHLDNVLVDHTGKACLVDAVGNRQAVDLWLRPAHEVSSLRPGRPGVAGPTDTFNDEPVVASTDSLPFSQRVGIDTDDLMKVVVSHSVDRKRRTAPSKATLPPDDLPARVATSLCKIVDDHPQEACGAIGQWLLRVADADGDFTRAIDSGSKSDADRSDGLFTSMRRWLRRN